MIGLSASPAAIITAHFQQTVGTSEEPLVLGDVAAPGWCIIINRGLTHFVSVKTGTGGVIFAKLLPGEFCLLRLGSGAQAPYVIADTITSKIEVFLTST